MGCPHIWLLSRTLELGICPQPTRHEGNDYDGRNFLDPTIDIEQTDESNYYKGWSCLFPPEINTAYYDFGNGPELVTGGPYLHSSGTVELDESKLTTESETEWILLEHETDRFNG